MGIDTGFVDSYDLFVEQMQQNSYRAHDGWREVRRVMKPWRSKVPQIRPCKSTALSMASYWVTATVGYGRCCAGGLSDQSVLVIAECGDIGRALALLPTAGCEEFGELLFEHDVCPLVNNIIVSTKTAICNASLFSADSGWGYRISAVSGLGFSPRL